uniref:Probable 3-oxoacyl-[acyl-carrier-protein] reductase oxidoreductase (EC) n=1 Tax=Ganoderma boninense TaxID=34458 RepID=A0A5K1JYQ7_9APHY|nr:Probable 3-oxoacyl-[acyl-carrier-protein] reductase oxidoreductase (EC [Ganoderma boninense]
MSKSSPRVWFITGASTGFGRAIAELVLRKGEIAVATARSPESPGLTALAAQYPPDRLLVLKLDVTQPQDIVAAFAQAKDAFGRIDVVVNNAAVAVMGEVEAWSEVDEGPVRGMFETNFWGAAKVTSEAVRFFREVNNPVGGRLLQMSSITGLIGGPGLGYYSASKHALEGLTESLASELDPSWNIKVTLVNPASFHTEGQAKTTWAPPHPAYSSSELPAARMRGGWGSYAPSGDVHKAVEVIYRLASEPEPPLHLLLGEVAHTYIKQKLSKLTAEVEKYESWSEDLKKDGL